MFVVAEFPHVEGVEVWVFPRPHAGNVDYFWQFHVVDEHASCYKRYVELFYVVSAETAVGVVEVFLNYACERFEEFFLVVECT